MTRSIIFDKGQPHYKKNVFSFEGSTLVWVFITDNAGNASDIKSGYVNIDTLPPEIIVQDNPEGFVSVSAVDSGSGVDASTWQHRLDGGSLEPGNSVEFPEGKTTRRISLSWTQKEIPARLNRNLTRTIRRHH